MLKNKAKEKVIEFTEGIKLLQQKSNDENLTRFIHDTEELIAYNEFGIALENLLNNLYEFEIKIDQHLIYTAKEAIQEMQLNWEEWKFIEALKQI